MIIFSLLIITILISVALLLCMCLIVRVPTTKKVKNFDTSELCFRMHDNFKIEDQTTTPKIIYQTYPNKAKIPSIVYNQIKQFAPDFTHIILDDKECTDLLQAYYSPAVMNTIQLLNGAHKADLIRYCLMYTFGGIYLDIKIEMIKNLSPVFDPHSGQIVTVLSGGNHKPSIFQGIIATPPRQRIFMHLIQQIVNIGQPSQGHYHQFCDQFYEAICEACGIKTVHAGINVGVNNQFFLLEEECCKSGDKCNGKLDRYGKCCVVYDGSDIVLHSRFSSYPWK